MSLDSRVREIFAKLPLGRTGCRYGLVAVDVRPDAVFMVGLRNGSEGPALSLFRRFSREADFEESEWEALASQLAPMVEEAQVAGCPVTTILYRPEVNFFLAEAPEGISREDLREAMRWRVREMIDIPVAEAAVDAAPVPLKSLPGGGPPVLVAAAHRDTVVNRTRALREAGVRPAYVDVPDMAQRNLSLLVPEPSAGTCMVLLDTRSALISITKGGELYFSRGIDLDMEAELHHLAEGLGLEPDDARRLRLELGLEAEDEEGASGQLAYALRDFADRLALEIQRSLDYYGSRYREAAINKVFLSGEGARIRGLEGYLSSMLGLELEFFNPLHYLEVEEAALEQMGELGESIFEGLVALGAGLRILESA